MLEDVKSLAGTEWNYDFHEIIALGKDASLERPGLSEYAAKTRPIFEKLARRWSAELHAEWLQRQYLALKLVMGATVQFGSAEHAYNENIQMAIPYLSYYGMFNAVRAQLLTSPRTSWGKNTLTIGHDAALRSYVEEIGLILSPEELEHESTLFIDAKRGRELFSYRFPSKGAPGLGGFFVKLDEAERFGRTAAELALFNSFCLNAAIENQFDTDEHCIAHSVDDRLLEGLWSHVLKGNRENPDFIYVDSEDKRCVKKMAEKITRPVPFIWMIGEGGVEDFFGALVSIEDDETAFNPDEHWHRLLELP